MRLEDISRPEPLNAVRESECRESVFKEKCNIYVYKFRNNTAWVEMNRSVYQTQCMPCQWFPHTGGSIPLRISRYINAINNRATTICKDMRICAGQMWSALFKYILTTAVMCASQSLSSAEKDYIVDRKKTGCLLSGIDDEERGAQRCGCCG